MKNAGIKSTRVEECDNIQKDLSKLAKETLKNIKSNANLAKRFSEFSEKHNTDITTTGRWVMYDRVVSRIHLPRLEDSNLFDIKFKEMRSIDTSEYASVKISRMFIDNGVNMTLEEARKITRCLSSSSINELLVHNLISQCK